MASVESAVAKAPLKPSSQRGTVRCVRGVMSDISNFETEHASFYAMGICIYMQIIHPNAMYGALRPGERFERQAHVPNRAQVSGTLNSTTYPGYACWSETREAAAAAAAAPFASTGRNTGSKPDRTDKSASRSRSPLHVKSFPALHAPRLFTASCTLFLGPVSGFLKQLSQQSARKTRTGNPNAVRCIRHPKCALATKPPTSVQPAQ